MMHTTLMVQGMTCESCRAAVQSALQLPGVDQVDVDLETGTVEVVHAENVTVEVLAGAVEDTGYEIHEAGSR